MKTVGLFEAKTKLSEICDTISKSGEAVTVTRRGEPLVRIEPIRKRVMTISEQRAQYFTDHPEDRIGEEKEFELPERSKEIRDPIDFDS